VPRVHASAKRPSSSGTTRTWPTTPNAPASPWSTSTGRRKQGRKSGRCREPYFYPYFVKPIVEISNSLDIEYTYKSVLSEENIIDDYGL
jgi:uncharacterized protein Veg